MSVKEGPSLPENEVIERGHEQDHISRRSLLLSVASLMMLGSLAILLAYGLSNYLTLGMVSDRHARPAPAAQTPGVKVTPDQPAQLRALRQSEEDRLNNYGWIVEPEGIARIPIERAMEIIAENGFPAVKPSADNPSNTKPAPEAEGQPNSEGQNDNPQ